MAVIYGKPIAPIYWPISCALASAIKGDNNRAIAVMSALLEAVKRESISSLTMAEASSKAASIAYVEGMTPMKSYLKDDSTEVQSEGIKPK